MMRLLANIITSSGYRDTAHFIQSTFHPDFAKQAVGISSALACIAYYVEAVFGIQLPVMLVVIILFLMEVKTGIMASGVGWKSDRFGKGPLKLFLYITMIGCTNILDIYAPSTNLFNIAEVDHFALIHFGFYNFVIIQLLGSNIENFIKLGWDKKSMLVRLLAKLYNIKEDEGKPD